MTQAPLRLSANGEHGFPVAGPDEKGVRVYLDGDLFPAVVAYDALAGFVEVMARDTFGNWLMIDGEYVTRRYYGEVRAVLP